MDRNIILWIARIGAAIILLQTLFFKFSGSQESVYIFTKVGMEPWGRIVTGIVELVASVLILIPKTSRYGALAALLTMGGAIYFHFTTIGVEVMGDGGKLFILAIAVIFCSVTIIALDGNNRFRIKRRDMTPRAPFRK